jgi:predicted RNase H-like nuclease (RuvC/YqgF family)
MGEELLNQPQDELEEKATETEELQQDTGVVKILRTKLEDEIKRRKELEKKLKDIEAVGSIANLEEITQKLNEIEKLKFENQIAKKFPNLVDEVDNIWEIKRQDENIEDAVARYLGKKQLENLSSSTTGYSVGSKQISPNLQEPDISRLPKEEQEKLAKKLFEQVYGEK